jgi:hypothetical protein
MLRHSVIGLVALLGLFLLGTTGLSPVEPAETARVAPVVPPDTLRSSVEAGTPLILSLPSTVRDTPVTAYAVLKGPALCGVAGRSFTWITRGTDPGTYDIMLRAAHANANADTLVVQVTIQ